MENGEYEKLAWQELESVHFIPNVIRSARHNMNIDTVVFQLKKNIKKGTLMQACFWASEMDLSGWAELLWDELFDMCYSDVGLVAPSSPCHTLDYYKMWKREIRKEKSKPSWQNIDACRILMSIVKYLCGVWKNRTVAHATMWSVMKAQTGVLTREEWGSSLGMGNTVDNQLEKIYQGHTPALCKRIDNLLLALVRNNEYGCVQHSDYLVISGNTPVVWKLIVICIEYTHERVSKNYYTWFIPYFKKYKQVCMRYFRQCEQDKYLKGGHLEIRGDMHSKDKGAFEFDDGTRTYPYMEHPYSHEYTKYASYMPYGTNFKPTNARRLNYIRKCVTQTVALMCRGYPNGVDERTPMDYICEDFFAKEIYSPSCQLPQERKQDNFRGVPCDWTTRDSDKYSTCTARHWWALADDISQVMEIPNRYSDRAFEALLQSETVYGRRSSEEFAIYRYLHSLAHYEGIVQPKPEFHSVAPYDADHILNCNGNDEYGEEMEESSESEHPHIVSSKEMADKRMKLRTKEIDKIYTHSKISDMIDSLRSNTNLSSEETKYHKVISSLAIPESCIRISDHIHEETAICKKTYNVIKDTTIFINALLLPILCYVVDICITMQGKIATNDRLAYKIRTSVRKNMPCRYSIVSYSSEDKENMMNVMQFIASWEMHQNIKEKKRKRSSSMIEIITRINESRKNGFICIKTKPLEITILTEVLISVIVGNGGKLFPIPLQDYMDKYPGLHCQEAYGILQSSDGTTQQCFWNHIRRFSCGRRCNCSIEEKKAWVDFLRELYTKHHMLLIDIILEWNKMTLNQSAWNIYEYETNVYAELEIPSKDEIVKRIKKTYSSIMANRAIAATIANERPSALDIIFCS